MRSSGSKLASFMAVASLVAIGSAMPVPRKGSGRAFRPEPPRMDTEKAREIAAWNAAVDAKKAAKKQGATHG